MKSGFHITIAFIIKMFLHQYISSMMPNQKSIQIENIIGVYMFVKPSEKQSNIGY